MSAPDAYRPTAEIPRLEVLGLRVRHLAELDLPATLTLSVEGLSAPVYLTTSRTRATELERAGACLLTPSEYELLAVALADGRTSRAEALEHLRAKHGALGHRLSRQALLGPVVHPDGGGDRWTFRDLFEALGAQLEAVELDP